MKIGIMLTSSCNFQCKHCMVDATLDSNLVSDEVLERFYEIVRYNKPDTVCILGGEPLLFLDKIEEIITKLKGVCYNFLVYSNGSFLLDKNKRERVKELGMQVRISKDRFHKDFWTPELERLIDECNYWKVEILDDKARIFPRGRALSNNVYTDQVCPCSLVNTKYKGYWFSDRFLVMQDGSVNIWCSCMSLELANIFNDTIITHDLLVEREALLREYLISVNMFNDNMLFMCNNVCNSFKVTKEGVFRDNELMQAF